MDADVGIALPSTVDRCRHVHVGVVEVGELALPVGPLELEEDRAQRVAVIERRRANGRDITGRQACSGRRRRQSTAASSWRRRHERWCAEAGVEAGWRTEASLSGPRPALRLRGEPGARFRTFGVAQPAVAIGVELLDQRPLVAIQGAEAEAALRANLLEHQGQRLPSAPSPPSIEANVVGSIGLLAAVHALNRCALNAVEMVQGGDEHMQRGVVLERDAIGDVDRRSLPRGGHLHHAVCAREGVERRPEPCRRIVAQTEANLDR